MATAYATVKRVLDVGLALVGLVVGAPLMALIALGLKLDSKGPVIFSQQRLGRGGRVFRMHKFRKFPADWGTAGAAVTVSGDARMTRFGRFLERSKFDEIPQLWNILKGEMSFVGPRPETLNFQDLFVGELRRVHDYAPGIFGPNQVAFRNEAELYPPDQDPETYYRDILFPQKARADIAYFSRATVAGDLGWIIAGLWTSVVGVANWGRLIRQRGRAVLMDLAFIELAWAAAFVLRFGGVPPDHQLTAWLHGAWLIPLVSLPLMILAGTYRSVVRHFAVGDALRLAVSTSVGVAIAALLLIGLFERNIAFSVIPFSLAMAVGAMVSARLYFRERWLRQQRNDDETAAPAKLLVYGAGVRGVALNRLLAAGFPGVTVVGFLDDNEDDSRGRSVGGYAVLGSERDLDTIHAVHGFSQLWLTFAPSAIKRARLRRWCEKAGVRLVVLPESAPFNVLVNGDADVWAREASQPTAVAQPASQLARADRADHTHRLDPSRA